MRQRWGGLRFFIDGQRVDHNCTLRELGYHERGAIEAYTAQRGGANEAQLGLKGRDNDASKETTVKRIEEV